MMKAVNVDPSQPWAPNARRQQHHQNAPADTIAEYWKHNMFGDHLTTELSSSGRRSIKCPVLDSSKPIPPY